MEYRAFGSTGFDVSAVAYGIAPIDQLLGPVPFEQAQDALFTAIDLVVRG